jgi:tetratricopeptide (TPR) repeat protein
LNADPDKARSALIHALQLQPHWPEALYDLGTHRAAKAEIGRRLAYYQQALAQDETYWPAAINIGNTLFCDGVTRARSVEFFERTLALESDYWPAQYNIAIVHFMRWSILGCGSAASGTVLDWRPEFREARYLLATSLTRGRIPQCGG